MTTPRTPAQQARYEELRRQRAAALSDHDLCRKLSIRLSEHEDRILRAEAARRGLTASAFAREALAQAAPALFSPELARDLKIVAGLDNREGNAQAARGVLARALAELAQDAAPGHSMGLTRTRRAR